MKNIAKNDFYEINVNSEKNRIYLTIKGFWKDPSQVPEYIDNWSQVVEMVQTGFTIVSDVKEMKPPSTSVVPLHESAQKMLVDAGLDRTAEIVGDAVLLEIQLKRLADSSSMKRAEFENLEAAEAWLDSEE